jgi:transposase-like protein
LPRPKKSFSPEFKDEAVKMVIETSRPIARVAKELGINEGTLGNWVSAYRREHAGEEPPLTVNERARLRELERETRELKMENDFLKKLRGPRGRWCRAHHHRGALHSSHRLALREADPRLPPGGHSRLPEHHRSGARARRADIRPAEP